jgi:hypothetical protein
MTDHLQKMQAAHDKAAAAKQPTEHTTHVESAIPDLQSATCPLVHLLMPHDYSDHQQRHEQHTQPASEEH